MTEHPCPHCGGDPLAPDHAARCDGRQGRVEARLPFDAEPPAPDIRGMVHADDPPTSIEAAETLEPKLGALHARVRAAFAAGGPMTDEELEELPAFVTYGPSTIRKRRSELYQAGQLEVVGERRNARGFSMLVWALVPEGAAGAPGGPPVRQAARPCASARRRGLAGRSAHRRAPGAS